MLFIAHHPKSKKHGICKLKTHVVRVGLVERALRQCVFLQGPVTFIRILAKYCLSNCQSLFSHVIAPLIILLILQQCKLYMVLWCPRNSGDKEFRMFFSFFVCSVNYSSCSQIHSPHDWGDKIDSGIGLSYRPIRLHRQAGRYDNPMPEPTAVHPPVRDYEFDYWSLI
jgi:hypothetical protein